MELNITGRACDPKEHLTSHVDALPIKRNWYAVFTLPQNEKSVLKHLDIRAIESFLPCYRSLRTWKNRQRIELTLPLFPSYLFVHIWPQERARVLHSPGVIQIVGNSREPTPIPDKEVEFLMSGVCAKTIEPFRELVVGEKVRIKSGVLEGIQGVLVRKNNGLRFVFTLRLISQNAAIEVDADNLEPVGI